MNCKCTAGTYVKEFVHGDLGRTSPSICGMLQCQVREAVNGCYTLCFGNLCISKCRLCNPLFLLYLQADIMQLDVTWLYDDFVGNMAPLQSTPCSDRTAMEVTTSTMNNNTCDLSGSQKLQEMSWEEFKTLKLANIAADAPM